MDFVSTVVNPIITHIVTPIIELAFAVAVIVFILGIVEMMMHGDDPEARKKGGRHMVAGVVGIFIMISAWGIIYFVSNTVSSFR